MAWRSSLTNEIQPGPDVTSEFNNMLDYLDQLLDKDRLRTTFSLLLLSKYGLWDSELLDILARQPHFHSSTTYRK